MNAFIKFLSGLFGETPERLHRDAALAADLFWQAAGNYTGEYTELGPAPVKIVICGSHETLQRKFYRAHGILPPDDVGEGYFWAADGVAEGIDAQTAIEIWLVVKDTGKNRIVNKWAAGHELMRAVDLLCRLQTGRSFGDAGKTDRGEYYGG
uniref:Uncharacterized protein n=2 Tax=viral metagenome TaxID=1070528 RepID=A0A6M3KS72_9ZZZZ